MAFNIPTAYKTKLYGLSRCHKSFGGPVLALLPYLAIQLSPHLGSQPAQRHKHKSYDSHVKVYDTQNSKEELSRSVAKSVQRNSAKLGLLFLRKS